MFSSFWKNIFNNIGERESFRWQLGVLFVIPIENIFRKTDLRYWAWFSGRSSQNSLSVFKCRSVLLEWNHTHTRSITVIARSKLHFFPYRISSGNSHNWKDSLILSSNFSNWHHWICFSSAWTITEPVLFSHHLPCSKFTAWFKKDPAYTTPSILLTQQNELFLEGVPLAVIGPSLGLVRKSLLISTLKTETGKHKRQSRFFCNFSKGRCLRERTETFPDLSITRSYRLELKFFHKFDSFLTNFSNKLNCKF